MEFCEGLRDRVCGKGEVDIPETACSQSGKYSVRHSTPTKSICCTPVGQGDQPQAVGFADLVGVVGSLSSSSGSHWESSVSDMALPRSV